MLGCQSSVDGGCMPDCSYARHPTQQRALPSRCFAGAGQSLMELAPHKCLACEWCTRDVTGQDCAGRRGPTLCQCAPTRSKLRMPCQISFQSRTASRAPWHANTPPQRRLPYNSSGSRAHLTPDSSSRRRPAPNRSPAPYGAADYAHPAPCPPPSADRSPRCSRSPPPSSRWSTRSPPRCSA